MTEYLKTDYENIRYKTIAIIETKNRFLYNLFGLDENQPMELYSDLNDYIEENIADGYYTESQIKDIRSFQLLIRNLLGNNDAVQVILVE